MISAQPQLIKTSSVHNCLYPISSKHQALIRVHLQLLKHQALITAYRKLLKTSSFDTRLSCAKQGALPLPAYPLSRSYHDFEHVYLLLLASHVAAGRNSATRAEECELACHSHTIKAFNVRRLNLLLTTRPATISSKPFLGCPVIPLQGSLQEPKEPLISRGPRVSAESLYDPATVLCPPKSLYLLQNKMDGSASLPCACQLSWMRTCSLQPRCPRLSPDSQVRGRGIRLSYALAKSFRGKKKRQLVPTTAAGATAAAGGQQQEQQRELL